MAAIVFKARLTDQTGKGADFARILFGTDSLEEKEKLFRETCKKKYPDWIIQEPISVAKSRLG